MSELFLEGGKGEETKVMFLSSEQEKGKARKKKKIYIYYLFIAAITYIILNLSDLKQHTFFFFFNL